MTSENGDGFDARLKTVREETKPSFLRRAALPVAVTAAALTAGGAVWFYEASKFDDPHLEASSVEEFQRSGGRAIAEIPPLAEPDPPRRIGPIPAAPVQQAMIADPENAKLRAEIRDLERRLEATAREAGRQDPAVSELIKANTKLAQDLVESQRRAARELAAERERLQADMKAELATLRLEMAASAPPPYDVAAARAREAAQERAAELEARRRADAEARRKAAAELAERQIKAPAVVFDDGASWFGAAVSPAASGELPARPENANEAFFGSAGASTTKVAVATQIPFPERTVVEGTFIHGVLETAIDSSLPGAIRATVSRDVWSYDGSTVLMPRGTRLIGTYRSDLSIAQERALVVWQRAVTPEGASVQLASYGTDRLGRSGLTGHVDTHFMERFGSAALISVIGAIPQIVAARANATDETEETIGDIGDDFRDGVSPALDEYLRIRPTIHVDQGDEIVVFAGRDLVILPQRR